MNRAELFRTIGDRIDVTDRDVYEFGIYLGDTMVAIEKELIERGKVPNRARYFDSFIGFPRDKSTWTQAERDHYTGDLDISFSAQCMLKSLSPEAAAAEVSKRCDPIVASDFVVGFFDESLKRAHDETWMPAAYVDIDVDLYCSARDVLDYMFGHGLIVPGTVIYYDDWVAGPEFESGESRAHKEMTDKWKAACTQIFHWQARAPKTMIFPFHIAKAFVVDSIG